MRQMADQTTDQTCRHCGLFRDVYEDSLHRAVCNPGQSHEWTPAEPVRDRTREQRLETALRKLLGNVEALMADSGGVYGLHLNGDPAPWDDLTDGGRFEDWLPLDHARDALKEASDAR